MQTGSYEVHKLLKLTKENKFRIPHFQRDFRWSYAQIKLLIDSMARNYPVGSLLMMAKSPEFNFQSRSIAAEISSDIEASSIFPTKQEDDFADNNIGSPQDVVIHLIPALEISAGLCCNHAKTNRCQGEQKCRPVPAAALRRS